MTELNVRQSQKEFYIVSTISFKRKSYSNSALKARAEIGKDFLYWRKIDEGDLFFKIYFSDQ